MRMRRIVSSILCGLWLVVVFITALAVDEEMIRVPGSVSLAGSLEAGSTFADLYFLDDMYGLLSLPSMDSYNDRYRIIEVSGSGIMEAQTPVLVLPEKYEFSDFVAASEGFYLTFLTDDGENAKVYFVESERLTDESVSGESPFEPALFETFAAREGTKLNWASYENGQFISWTQDGRGAEFYEENVTRDEACRQAVLDMGERSKINLFRLICCTGAVAAGWVIIWLLVRLLWHRSSTVYLIVFMEAALFIVILTGTVLTINGRNNAAEDETRSFAGYYMDTIKERAGGDLTQLGDLLVSSAEHENVKDNFRDLCVVDISDHRILASMNCVNGVVLEDFYKDSDRLVWDEEDGTDTSSWIMAAVLRDRPGFFENSYSGSYMIAAVCLFAVLSVICAGFLMYRERDLVSFRKALAKVSSGEECAISGRIRTADMTVLWNNLMEIQKKFHRINYSQYKVLESCYRFAPKNIENIFGKASITEVHAGDSVTVNGTIAFVTYDEPDCRDREASAKINRFVSALCRFLDEDGGFFVSGSSDLSELKVLFPEENGSGTEFATNFLSVFYSGAYAGKSGIFLHHTDMVYGVAGNESQSFPFLLMDEKEQLERYAAWFESMDLRMVMTGEVIESENYAGEVRYIGYLLLNDKRMDIYEALNVCPAWERRVKVETGEKFQKALDLFYRHDFYLARSGFSDVLKENDADQIAKWYLFTCEKYLNSVHSEGDICCLQI